MKFSKCIRAVALALVLALMLCGISFAETPHWIDVTVTPLSDVFSYYFGGSGQTNRPGTFGSRGGFGGSTSSQSNSRGYYTYPTATTVDSNNNTTNYYRSGETTSVSVVNTTNKTFNAYQTNDYRTYNTTSNYNNTNYWKYQANVDLSNFLNTYNYTTNNYAFDVDYNTYTYNTVNNTYHISVDDRTYNYYYDETVNNYLVDAREYTTYEITNNYYTINYDYDIEYTYTPTYVEVNYISKTENVNNVTNIYYYELNDGRNSSTLTINEINGLDISVGVGNYDQVVDKDNILSLQHFDGNYDDSSGYARERYDGGYRSTTYVDDGSFGKAVSLASGYRAGVRIPDMDSYEGLQIDFRVNVDSLDSLGIYIGDMNVFQSIPSVRTWTYRDLYTGLSDLTVNSHEVMSGTVVTPSSTYWSNLNDWLSTARVSSPHTAPSAFSDSGYIDTSSGYFGNIRSWGAPSLSRSNSERYITFPAYSSVLSQFNPVLYAYNLKQQHATYYTEYVYTAAPTSYIRASTPAFSANTWISYRIVLQGGLIYFYVNGDLAGSGSFTMPDADYFYLRSSGTVLLDELRILDIGSAAPTAYNPATQPYDTNLVYALPDNPELGCVYIRSSVPATYIRVGGVRPSVPDTGFVYIPLDENYLGAGCQQYDGSNWLEVDGYIYDDDGWHSVIAYQFWTVGQAEDVTVPSEEEPTPTESPVPTPTPTDNPGGSGGGNSGDGDNSGDDGFFGKLGEFLGTVLGNGLKLLGAALSAILDALIALVNMIGDKLTQVVETVLGFFEEIPPLFSGFLDFLEKVFPFFPSEIMLLLTFGIAAVVFIGIIKAIRR